MINKKVCTELIKKRGYNVYTTFHGLQKVPLKGVSDVKKRNQKVDKMQRV